MLKLRTVVQSQYLKLIAQSASARKMSSSSNSEIEFTKRNHIGCILLNRPKQLNALTLNMVKVMYEYLEECERDPAIKAVVVKGAGETAYCAGGDVKSVRDLCLKGYTDILIVLF